jgi:hypothetical protein
MRSETPEYLPVLIGISDASNSKAGFACAAPTLIGSAEAAKAVLANGSDRPLLGVTQLDANSTKLLLANVGGHA